VTSRQADPYVFALLAHLDKATLDPLNVAQWRFYVVAPPVLANRTGSQHSITLGCLEKLAQPCAFAELGRAVLAASALSLLPDER
jgi:hypothetical protein